jgi:hypothetical protein
MKHWLLIILLAIGFHAFAQEPLKRYDFPVTLTIHFPALAMPFRNAGLNFRNIGVGIGTEVTLNHSSTWVQQFQIAWLRNRQTGNGLLAYTQLAWRPEIGDNGFTEIKAGIGYQYAFTAAPALHSKGGEWQSARHRGKGMLALPVGVAFGYHYVEGANRYTPFAGYQFMLLTRYNTTVPLIPQTIIQTGLSIAK